MMMIFNNHAKVDIFFGITRNRGIFFTWLLTITPIQDKNIGCGIIGSGAIESAHRTVIQRRMKLSGQRWGIKGAKNMLRLRVIAMNKQWAKVIDFLKTHPLSQCA